MLKWAVIRHKTMGIEKYEGIIDHEHHVSARHPRMSMLDRAAQFAPFAALTGYDDVIRETGRQTDSRLEMDEYLAGKLNGRLAMIAEHIEDRPPVTLVVFEQDSRKNGGRYTTVEGRVRTIDFLERKLILTSGRHVSLDDIADIVY